MKLKVGDAVQYTTDKAWKYRGIRFRVLAIKNGDVAIGSPNWKLEDATWISKGCLDCLKVVKSPKNVAVYE